MNYRIYISVRDKRNLVKANEIIHNMICKATKTYDDTAGLSEEEYKMLLSNSNYINSEILKLKPNWIN